MDVPGDVVRRGSQVDKGTLPVAMLPPRWRSTAAILVLPWVYLVLSSACSVVYLSLVACNLTNDYLWSDFNLTSQTFVGDAFNSAVVFGTAWDVLLSGVAVQKTYQGSVYMDTNPASPRQLVLSPQPLHRVIESLRRATTVDSLIAFTQYCWVDLNRTFEMAHTEKRQMRCHEHFRANGAVYLEPSLRNIPGGVNASKLASAIQVSVLDAVSQWPVGLQWLDDLHQFKWGSIELEVAFWQAHGVTTYVCQAQNLYQHGMQDTVTIVNAMNMVQQVKINHAEFLGRGLSQWTTAIASIGPWNDFNLCYHGGCSLVRAAPNSLNNMGYSYDVDVMMGPSRTPNIDLVRTHVGPFGSMDLFMVPLPPDLVAYFEAFQTTLFHHVRQHGVVENSSSTLFEVVRPIPWSWRGLLYTGGNPLCQFYEPRPFIQDSFGFYDVCQVQKPLESTLQLNSVLFALQAAGPSERTTVLGACNLSTSSTQRCESFVNATQTLFEGYVGPSMTARQWNAVTALNLTLVQMASIPNTSTLVWLEQPLIAKADPWSLFGWVAIYDWLTGHREVFSLQGDEGTYTMMSPRHDALPLAANALELPQQACWYVWLLTMYSTALMAMVAMLVFVARGMSSREGYVRPTDVNLFQFSRVVGSIWIGRPILVLRGLTAVMILSTASLEFTTRATLTSFERAPRSLLYTGILAGEATWTTFVLSDVLLPVVSPAVSKVVAPTSVLLTWLAFVVGDVALPVEATITIDRQCTIRVLSYDMACETGAVSVGKFHRFLVSLVFQCGGCVVLYVLSGLWLSRRQSTKIQVLASTPPSVNSIPNLILPAVAVVHLENATTHATSATWELDGVGCVMAGMLPLGTHLFDVKLWLFYHPSAFHRGVYTFAPTTFQVPPLQATTMASLRRPFGTNDVEATSRFARLRLRSFVGFTYVIVTVMGSLSYLTLSKNSFSNDFLWSSFNATGTLMFMSNWYNVHLQYVAGSGPMPFTLTSPTHGDPINTYNTTDTTLSVPPLYASALQHHVGANLASVVQGLRRMDGCAVPWIFSPYCYVDFERSWEMAVTAARQLRCQQNDVDNGAVYMAAVLRNANWNDLTRCWGAALETGLFAYLRTFDAGQRWIATVQRNAASVGGEVQVWHDHGIEHYLPQWQNFKALGAVESFSVQNAVGILYPLTLKHMNGSFQLGVETTFKMYWGLACDLWAVASNTSGVGGLSLIRQSSAFAYANMSLRSVYLGNASLHVLGRGFVAIESMFGPFGSIDMKRIPVPDQLRTAVQATMGILRKVLTTSVAAQQDYAAAPQRTGYDALPTAWDDVVIVAGNILCDVVVAQPFDSMYSMFTMEGACPYQTVDRIYTQPYTTLAAWAMQMPPNATTANDVTAVCSREVVSRRQCLDMLNHTCTFLQSHLTSEQRTTIHGLASAAQPVVGTVQLSQFVQGIDGAIHVATTTIMNATDRDYQFYGWLYLLDWVQGTREVVAFQGDAMPPSRPTVLLSGYTPQIRGHVNAMEIPANASFYIRCLVQYVSFVLCCVACAVCMVIVSSRGNIEGYNMLLFNRVAGVVWVGRPLALLRGLAAIALLSTSNLIVDRAVGCASIFAEPPEFWGMTFMAAGELTWLVYIINDTLSIVTTSYTAQYASKSS
ncbi:hypothetical protein DYB32_009354, partial [Aphanomyces invadans]